MGKVSIISGMVFGGMLALSPLAYAQDAAEAADYLVMPPNAEVVFITTGGAEPRADWSDAARMNFESHVSDQLTANGHSFMSYETSEDTSDDIEQLMLLQELVTASLSMHIPHKEGNGYNNTDLSLGDSVSLLRGENDVDEVLFVDHYSQIESSGVFLMAVAVGTVTGYVPPSNNVRFSRFSTFDMETGDLTNTAIHMFGDPRDVGESQNIVSNLMRGMSLAGQ